MTVIMNILFLCTSNINRSKTCEDYFRDNIPIHKYKSAGLSFNNCKRFNTTICTHELLDWADIIFVFEQMHINRIEENHDNLETLEKIINLNIEDVYQYMSKPLLDIITNNHIIKKHLN